MINEIIKSLVALFAFIIGIFLIVFSWPIIMIAVIVLWLIYWALFAPVNRSSNKMHKWDDSKRRKFK